jgi:uncharacterized protein (DUF1697 family)
MTTRVAFLRAVNLGSRQVRMARLVEIFEGLGYGDVWTHINSGNVVFDATGSRDALERRIGSTLEQELGFECTTTIRTPAELKRALAQEPFTVAAADTYFLTFLKDPPTAAQRTALEALSNDFDTLVVLGRDVHWRMHGKSSDSKLTAKLWADIVGDRRSTSRNTRMLRTLVDKISARR